MMGSTKAAVPLLPREDAREAALFFVVCALCFLAALAALAARASYAAADAWTSQVEGEVTVRLKVDDRRAAEEALDVITATEGVEAARILSRSELEELLRPVLGSNLPSGLPLPVMIAVQSSPDNPSIAPDIQRRLIERQYTAFVDDHAEFAKDIRRGLTALRLIAFGAVALLAATAVSVIAFATHAALLARRDIVEILHLVGAQDGYISNLFERRFWTLGLQAGAVGAIAALGVVALLIAAARYSPTSTWLLPRLELDVLAVAILVLTPLLAAIAARIATRVTVLLALADTV